MNRLDAEQEELLTLLVEAERSVPREERHAFRIRRPMTRTGGVRLLHAGWNYERRIFDGDIEILAQEGLVNVQHSPSGRSALYVTPLGVEYYQYLSGRQAEPLVRVQDRIIHSLNGSWFISRYPTAYQKWCEAEALLADDASDVTASVVGHLAREAMQEFADVVVRRLQLANPPDKAKTIARMRAAIAARKPEISTTVAATLEALLSYWESLNELIQRQEHSALREGEGLTWADSRRVVFLLAVAFYELDIALG